MAKIGVEKAGLSSKQRKVLMALIQSPTYKEAARIAGVGESTVQHYMMDTDFRSAYDNCMESLLQEACGQSQRSMSSALSTLWEICEDKDENSQTRVQAARAILEYGLKLTEVADLDARVSALEEEREKRV